MLLKKFNYIFILIGLITFSASAFAKETQAFRVDVNNFFFGGKELSQRYLSSLPSDSCELMVKNVDETTTLTVSKGSVTLSFDIYPTTQNLIAGEDHDLSRGILQMTSGAQSTDFIEIRKTWSEFYIKISNGLDVPTECVVKR